MCSLEDRKGNRKPSPCSEAPCCDPRWVVLVSRSCLCVTGGHRGLGPIRTGRDGRPRHSAIPLSPSLLLRFLSCLVCVALSGVMVVFFRCLYLRWERTKRALKPREEELDSAQCLSLLSKDNSGDMNTFLDPTGGSYRKGAVESAS